MCRTVTTYHANYVYQFLIALLYFEKMRNFYIFWRNEKKYHFAFFCVHIIHLMYFSSNFKVQQPVFLTNNVKSTHILHITIIIFVTFQFSTEITTKFWYEVTKIPSNRYF